jgi:carbonyl reductase 1
MKKVAVVTGANQGLGLALVEGLSRALGPSGVVYLTARDPGRGEAAVRASREAGIQLAFHPLDVTSDASVAALADHLGTEHGGVDIVISNAAARITRDRPQAEQVAGFIETNNHGTHRMIRAISPLLRDGARFLVVASSFGSLRNLSPALHGLFDVTTRSLEDIERAMDDYVSLVQAGRAEEEGWPGWINVPSKVAQVASMKIMAHRMRDEARRRGILIDAVCPGLVDTAASRPWFEDMSSAQTPAQAAMDVLWLAMLPAETAEPYGELVRHRSSLPWF